MTFELMMKEVSSARKAAQSRTAWRIDGTLREFAKFEPLNLWFDYPVHRVDNTGILKDVAENDKLPTFQKATLKRQQNNADRNEKNRIKFENAINICNDGEPPTVKQLMEYLDLNSRKTTKNWISRYGYQIDKNTDTVIESDNNSDDT